MLKKQFKKKGSAYLVALGVVGVLTTIGIMVSKMTTSGRWNTILTSNEKRAEECAESANNMMFRVIKDNMNDYGIFYKLFSHPADLLNTSKKDFCFLYFRLPTYMAEAYLDPVKFQDARNNGIDVQLDLFKGAFQPLYDRGFTFIYDTETPVEDSPLAPLKSMFESYGGRVRVTCTGKIKAAFGILAENPKFNIPGMEVPLSGVTGFMGKLFDKVKVMGNQITSTAQNFKDPTGEGNDSTLGFNLLEALPDDPLLKAPDITNITIIVEGVPVPVGAILQIPLNKIFEKIAQAAHLTPRGLAELIFGDSLTIEIDISGITNKIEDAIKGCLPESLQFFTGNISHGVTVEKQGIFEVETVVEYYPNDPYDENSKIVKKLIAEREFRVADIQPIAPDYSFFVANSKLLYERNVENTDNWEGDDKISWNDGSGDLVVHNLPSLKSIVNTLKNIFTFDFKDLLREIQLPGLVRVNGTKKMQLKLSMFPKLSFSIDNLRKMEIMALLLGHKSGDTDCSGSHPSGGSKHSVVPNLKSVTYNFFDDGKPFDWGYFGGGSPGGIGSYWLPIAPRYGRTMLFGNFHLEFPFSLRVEGYLTKIYSHIKMLLVKIYIPPIPIIGFLGMDIPIPWFWATAHEEPYGFCRYPPYDKEEDAETTWDPNEEKNLPANAYSTAQYLKKASYFYESSAAFNRDLDNRSIEYNGKKTFICDGVTFVNDNLRLKDLHVMGRGIIVAAANVHIDGNITREDFDKDGNSTVFSIIARSGAILTGYGKREVNACLFADKGLQVPIGGGLKLYGNLCLNRCNRSDIGGDVDVHYQSNHCRSSLLSMIKPIAKFDPTRYHVTFSSKFNAFQFVRQDRTVK